VNSTQRNRTNEYALSAELLLFIDDLETRLGPLPLCQPGVVAREFSAWFDLNIPVTIPAITELINRLQYSDVTVKPYLEATYDIRGHWHALNDAMTILVDGNRPAASRVRTLLHEVIEPVWTFGKQRLGEGWRIEEREAWCNAFSSAVRMPPHLVKKRAIDTGYDLRTMATEFNETLSAMARQMRNVCFPREFFYYCRLEVKFGQPKEAPDRFTKALSTTRALCLRTVDVVKTPGLHLLSDRPGARPGYNLPAQDEYRIAHPRLRRHIAADRPIFVPSFVSEWGPNYAAGDLFECRTFCALLYTYGYLAKPAFFAIVLPASQVPRFDPLLQSAQLCSDIDWLFRF